MKFEQRSYCEATQLRRVTIETTALSSPLHPQPQHMRADGSAVTAAPLGAASFRMRARAWRRDGAACGSCASMPSGPGEQSGVMRRGSGRVLVEPLHPGDRSGGPRNREGGCERGDHQWALVARTWRSAARVARAPRAPGHSGWCAMGAP